MAQKDQQEKEQKIEEEHIPCNLCGQNNYNIIYEKIDTPLEIPLTDKFSAAKGILSTDQIVKCRNCGLVYTNPRIKSTIIIDSCSQGDDEVYVSQEEGRKKTFQEGIDWIKKVTQKKESDKETSNEKKKILDVGCAAGFFLAVAKESDFDPYGSELNAWLAEYGRKKFNLENVKAGTLEDAKWKDNFFDHVTMWDVLEHVPDPMKTLKEINRITKNNGYIIISYPDYSSIFAKLFGRRWWFLLSHHIYYFTPKTMDMMLEKAGFEIVTDKMHWQELKIVYMLDMFVKLNKNPIIKAPFQATSTILKAVGLKDMKVRYYASQRDIIAQKKRASQ
ncbi:class I SAM-dependent methyltransferase [Candidatus Woesearchaeota archaeon]|nr:class I SAM-dependent methyltransferase [Candidatus Woesearchaeota archaeon]